MRILISLGALSALGAVGVLAQDPTCLESCVKGTGDKFIEFGCVDAIQEGCLCVQPNYQYSVRDCGVQTCNVSGDQALDFLFNTGNGFCKAHPRPETSAASTTEEPASTTEESASATEEPASTTEEQVSTTEESVATTEPTYAATSATEDQATTTEGAPTSTPTGSEGIYTGDPTTATSTLEPSSTEDVEPSTTSKSEDTAQDGNEDESQDGGGGLSSGATAGIGVGVAVIVIAIAVVVAVIFMRRRRNRQPSDQSVDISRHIPPVAGRAYPSVDRGSFGEKGRGGESIEMHTNRYEDMPPRQTPRIMV